MLYFERLVKDMNAQLHGKSSISVLVLAYTLTPEAVFPTQLRQATNLLSYLISDQKRSPSSIMLTGDSAGGGLLLSLLSHLLHPRSDVPKVSLSAPLRGAFPYSPWVSFSTTSSSFARNLEKDTLEPSMLRKWACFYLGTITTDAEAPIAHVVNDDVYAEPLLADPPWWQGLHKVVEEVLVWTGSDEIFVDGIREYGTKLKEGWRAGGGHDGGVQVVEGKREPHIGPLMDVMLQSGKKEESQILIEEWLLGRLR
jgi:acetyl esterase/lipase